MTLLITKTAVAKKPDGTFLVGLPVGTEVRWVGRAGVKLVVSYLGVELLIDESLTDVAARSLQI